MNILLKAILVLLVLSSFSSVNTEDVRLEQSIKSYSFKNLKKIALALENKCREKKSGIILGGLHDYIDSLSDDKISKIIFDYISIMPEYKDISALEALAKIEHTEPPTKFADKLRDGYFSRSKLEALALAADKYDIDHQEEKRFGGLHDYIRELRNQELVDFIDSMLKKYNELKEGTVLEDLANGKTLSLNDFSAKISKLDHDTLVHWAIAVDEYDRENSSILRLGGVHDYAYRLSIEELNVILLEFAGRWPEILKDGFIEELILRDDNEVHQILGGFEDYIFTLEREDLIKCALASEDYDRKKRNLKLLGGLHDYVNTLSNDQIVNIVVKYLHKYPEMRTPGFIENLANIYKGGFKNYLQQKDIEWLREVCITLDNYDRKIREIHIKGGIHDYVHILSKAQLIDYILNKADMYPHLRESNGIEKIKK